MKTTKGIKMDCIHYEIMKYKISDKPSKIQIAYWKDLEKTHENLVAKIEERIEALREIKPSNADEVQIKQMLISENEKWLVEFGEE